MNTVRVLYHLALADFYERTRRYSFLLVLAAVIYLGVLVNNGTLGLELGAIVSNQHWIRYRGELNSAWIGAMTVMEVNLFLGLLGFYLVNDCITRDIRTGVGQIIATTPVSRAAYLVGKWISNCLVLSVLILILAVAAAIMVLFQSETELDLGALLMPFLVVALPNMALTAALAVVFETVPWLRGALGNVAYFFTWVFSTVLLNVVVKVFPLLMDPAGHALFGSSLYASARAAYPLDPIKEGLSVGVSNPGAALAKIVNIPEMEYRIFNWPGLDWTPGIIGGQWLWAAFGLGLILLSTIWFARFDPSREGLRGLRIKPEEGEPAKAQNKAPRLVLPSLSPLFSKLAQVNPFLGALFAELRMLLNGRRWWWWAVTIGLNFVILSSPLEITTYLLPAAWLWPLAIWSEMGNRERKNNTSQMVFSSSRPVMRQLPAAWLAGVLTTALLVTGGPVIFLSHGDLLGLASWAGAVVFVPSLALALGVFSSGSRFFEVVYVIWWYIGPLQKIPGLDFTSGAPLIYLLAAAGLLLLSMYWRGRQVRV